MSKNSRTIKNSNEIEPELIQKCQNDQYRNNDTVKDLVNDNKSYTNMNNQQTQQKPAACELRVISILISVAIPNNIEDEKILLHIL